MNYDIKCTHFNVFGNWIIIYMRANDALFLNNHMLASDSLSSDCNNYRYYDDCYRLVIKSWFKFSNSILTIMILKEYVFKCTFTNRIIYYNDWYYYHTWLSYCNLRIHIMNNSKIIPLEVNIFTFWIIRWPLVLSLFHIIPQVINLSFCFYLQNRSPFLDQIHVQIR